MISPERFLVGIWITLGVFALKAGIGLYLACKDSQGITRKVRMFALYLFSYLFLFSLLGYLWMINKTIGSLSRILINFGQEIHLLVSFSLMLLGYHFLTKGQNKADKKAWLSLLLPCPICISTVFLTLGFALQYFPNLKFLIIFALYSGFVFLSLLAFIGIWAFENYKGNFNHSNVVGAILVVTSIYTTLTLLFSNGIIQAKSLVNVTINKPSPVLISNLTLLPLVVLLCFAFLSGYIKSKRFFFYHGKRLK